MLLIQLAVEEHINQEMGLVEHLVGAHRRLEPNLSVVGHEAGGTVEVPGLLGAVERCLFDRLSSHVLLAAPDLPADVLEQLSPQRHRAVEHSVDRSSPVGESGQAMKRRGKNAPGREQRRSHTRPAPGAHASRRKRGEPWARPNLARKPDSLTEPWVSMKKYAPTFSRPRGFKGCPSVQSLVGRA